MIATSLMRPYFIKKEIKQVMKLRECSNFTSKEEKWTSTYQERAGVSQTSHSSGNRASPGSEMVGICLFF